MKRTYISAIATVIFILVGVLVFVVASNGSEEKVTSRDVPTVTLRSSTTLGTTTTTADSTTTSTVAAETTTTTTGAPAKLAVTPTNAITAAPETVGVAGPTTTRSTTVPVTTTTVTTTTTPVVTTTVPVTTAPPPVTTVLTPPAPAGNLQGTIVRWDNNNNPNSTVAVGTFRLTWSDNSTNEDGFRIYQNRHGCNQGRTLLLSTAANVTAATVVQSGYSTRACLDVYLEVVAFNAAGELAWPNYPRFSVQPPNPSPSEILTYELITASTARITFQNGLVYGGFYPNQFYVAIYPHPNAGLGGVTNPTLPGPTFTFLDPYGKAHYTWTIPLPDPSYGCVQIVSVNNMAHQYDISGWRYSAPAGPNCIF